MIEMIKSNAGWLAIVAALIITLLSASGSEVSHKIFVSGNDTVIVKAGADEGFLGSILNRPTEALPVGTETISRADRGFVVYYKVKATLRGEGSLLNEPAEYRIDLPGTVLVSNADKIEDGAALWIIGDDQDEKIAHSTRYVRWWLIIALVFGAGFSAYGYLRSKE